ncbi:MAG TPA: PstS family phosphate ABC transporter substrate-binding protein [Candidatus Sulfomarinibacteraceae bacterium]|nr:PstS family phosphate ABC transporter substrate-binding protein [Candidatus Sulfomarinibacteraceae bacterium]
MTRRHATRRTARLLRATLALGAMLALAACGGGAATPVATAGTPSEPLTGAVTIDGSSTVYPITAAVAEEFQIENPGVRVTVAFSGTGGGFKKFCSTGADATDANDASRPIKSTDKPGADGQAGTADDELSEATLCRNAGIEPVELKVAYDGLSVVVNPANHFVDCLTTAELKAIWDQGSTVRTWADVRPGWPAAAIELFGPGADSGTFDYFTEAINGEAKRSRSNYTPSEDDNALVQGVANDENGLGYFGFAYFEENADRLKVVPIDGGDGCVAPAIETIKDGSYSPLSRPLFVYPSRGALARPEVAAFFDYYVDHVTEFAEEVGYVALPADELAATMAVLTAARP